MSLKASKDLPLVCDTILPCRLLRIVNPLLDKNKLRDNDLEKKILIAFNFHNH